MLTPKQENFCLAYLETGNASEAYRRAYNTARMKTATIQRKAKELLHSGPIAARNDELRQPVRDAVLVTLETHIRDLDDDPRWRSRGGAVGSGGAG